MRLTITARHMELPPTLEELLRAKVENLERFGHKLFGLHAVFDREHYLYTAELTLTLKGLTLVGRAKDPKDILTCMEVALSRLKDQLQHHEEKLVEMQRRRAPHRPA